MAECLKKTDEFRKEGLLRDGRGDIDGEIIAEFNALAKIEQENVIAALSLFLSVQAEAAFDPQLACLHNP